MTSEHDKFPSNYNFAAALTGTPLSLNSAAQQKEIAIAKLVCRWFDAAKADHILRDGLKYSNYDQTNYTVGQKYFHLVIGTSSAFLVDIATGTIYGNKGWLKVDRFKIVGNAYDLNFDAAALVRDRFRYGRFENNPDGSLRQPIVRR